MTPHTTLDASAADLRGMQDNQTYYLAGTQTTLGNPIVAQGGPRRGPAPARSGLPWHVQRQHLHAGNLRIGGGC